MQENPFIGTWALVSFELRSTNGLVSYPFGPDMRGGSIEEKVLAFNTYFSYCGKHEIRGEKSCSSQHYVHTAANVGCYFFNSLEE